MPWNLLFKCVLPLCQILGQTYIYNKSYDIYVVFVRSPCLKMDVCRVHISNRRWWSFILIVYRDGWKVWGWSRVDIYPLYGPWMSGSRIWPLLPPLIWGANGDLMASSACFYQISSLGELLYSIWRACAPFWIILGGFPCGTWCFPPLKEACPT